MHENDVFYIPDTYKQMTVEELRKDKERIYAKLKNIKLQNSNKK